MSKVERTIIDGIEHRTAVALVKLATLRGIVATVHWDVTEKSYILNGERMGCSVQTVMERFDELSPETKI